MSLEEYSNNLTNDFKSRGWIVLVLRDTLFLDNTDKEYPMYDIVIMKNYHQKQMQIQLMDAL